MWYDFLPKGIFVLSIMSQRASFICCRSLLINWTRKGCLNVEENVEIRIQVILEVTYKLTVKKLMVAYFVEILRFKFDFVDWNTPQSCLSVAESSFSITIQSSVFAFSSFFSLFSKKSQQLLSFLVFQLWDVLH